MKGFWYMKRFFEVDRLERKILIKSIWMSGLIRFMTKYLPFRFYQEFIHPEIKDCLNYEDMTFITRKINKTLRRVERFVPWTLSCLVKAIVARKLFAEVGINGNLILSLVYNEKKNLKAHAIFRPDINHYGIRTDSNKKAFLFYF
jgi:hypothetical protein